MSPLEEMQSGNLVVPPHLQDKLTSPLTQLMSERVRGTVTFPQRLIQSFQQNPVGLGLSRSDYTDIPGQEPANPSVGMATDLAMNMVGAPIFTTNAATLGSGVYRGGLPKLPVNDNEFDLVRAIQNRIQNNPELAARASEPMQAAGNQFVQRSLANAQRRSDASTKEIMANLPEKPRADDILSAVLGLSK